MSQGGLQIGTSGHDRDVRASLDQQRRRQRDLEEGDIVAEHPRRLILRSPSGTYWTVTVGDDGTLSTVAIGPKL